MSTYLSIQKKLFEQNKIIVIVSTVFFAVLVLFTSYNIYSCLGLFISTYITLRFILMLGHTIPVIELMLFLAAAQWILGPFFDYQSSATHYKMHMYVSELRYMEITIPLYFVFAISSLSLFKYNSINIEYLKEFVKKNNTVPLLFIGIGVFFNLIQAYVPASISFVVYLGSNLSLVGLGLFYLREVPWSNKWILTAIAIAPVLINSIRTGTFHTLIIWGIFIFILINLVIKLSFLKKVVILLVSVFFLATLQLIKQDYRDTIKVKSFEGNKLELFINLLMNSENTNELQDENELNNVNSRLNQGWIISKIYERIPSKKKYLEGETIRNAFEALIPRFLYPEKKVSGGGKKTFELLTGIYFGRAHV